MSNILNNVGTYYSARLAEHGATPRGVDWNGEESQSLRFRQLEKLIDIRDAFSVNDLGCGYGAFLSFLDGRHVHLDYLGCDIASDMVVAAQKFHSARPNAAFEIGSEPSRIADYGFASGVFNVRLSHDNAEWRDYMSKTLDILARTSRRGFAFNCLTSYSDAEKMRDHLFYAHPGAIFDLCKSRYARNVALLHDYGLYEFTILVRKDL